MGVLDDVCKIRLVVGIETCDLGPGQYVGKSGLVATTIILYEYHMSIYYMSILLYE